MRDPATAGPRLLAAVVVALLLSGCGGKVASNQPPDRPPAATVPARPATLCTPLRARVTGEIDADEATELSGLVLSRSHDDVLWTHNDSGNDARVFAVAPDGRLLADVEVMDAENGDWEDIAIGPGDALFIGDIGDNRAKRSDIVVYRVPEPRLAGGPPGETAPAQRLTLRYPDGAHDAEALLVDPSSGALVIVTKTYDGTAGVYVADRPSTDDTTTMRRAGSVSLAAGQAVTAGDVSADGRTIVLRPYDHAFVWSRRRGESLAAVLGRRRPCTAGTRLPGEGQGEAIALTPGGRAFYTVPEGDHPPLRRYSPAG